MSSSAVDAETLSDRRRAARDEQRGNPRPVPRSARYSEVAEVAGVLQRAFAGDPAVDWFLQGRQESTRAAVRMFALQVGFEYLPYGRVDVAEHGGRIVGAGLWGDPGTPKAARVLAGLRSLPHSVELFGLAKLADLRTFVRDCAQYAPDRPHWYLADLGTVPEAQGTGAGGALLRTGLGRADQDGVPVHLESSKVENVPLYEKFGFRVTGEVRLPGGPVLYAMLREPERG